MANTQSQSTPFFHPLGYITVNNYVSIFILIINNFKPEYKKKIKFFTIACTTENDFFFFSIFTRDNLILLFKQSE
jgi:hypothetical protein